MSKLRGKTLAELPRWRFSFLSLHCGEHQGIWKTSELHTEPAWWVLGPFVVGNVVNPLTKTPTAFQPRKQGLCHREKSRSMRPEYWLWRRSQLAAQHGLASLQTFFFSLLLLSSVLTGAEVIGASWKAGQFHGHQETFLTMQVTELWHRLPRVVVQCLSLRATKPRYNPGQPALGAPAWAGGTRWPLEIPSCLHHYLWFCGCTGKVPCPESSHSVWQQGSSALAAALCYSL